MNKLILTTTLMALLGAAACSQSVAPTEPTINAADKAKIEAAVMDYFDGQGEASLERLDRAFNDNASMFGVITDKEGNSGLKVWPKMSDVIVNWSKSENPAGAGRDHAFLDIEVTDDRIATVHFRSADRFYDVLTLVKINGEWEIAAKVFVRQ